MIFISRRRNDIKLWIKMKLQILDIPAMQPTPFIVVVETITFKLLWPNSYLAIDFSNKNLYFVLTFLTFLLISKKSLEPKVLTIHGM